LSSLPLNPLSLVVGFGVFEEAANRFLDGVCGFPSKYCLCLRGVDGEVFDECFTVPARILDEFDIDIDATLFGRNLLDEFRNRLHARVLIGRNFVRFDASLAGVKLVEQAFGAVDVRTGDVVDVDVVPGLGARLVDGEWLPVQRAVHEEIDDRPLGDALAVDLVFPIQVRLEEEVRGERVLRKCLDSAFADEFRAAVPVERVSGVVGSNRELLGVAEHGHAEREDEAGAGLPAEPRDVVRPRDVDLVGAVLILLAVINAADGSEMQNNVRALEGGL